MTDQPTTTISLEAIAAAFLIGMLWSTYLWNKLNNRETELSIRANVERVSYREASHGMAAFIYFLFTGCCCVVGCPLSYYLAKKREEESVSRFELSKAKTLAVPSAYDVVFSNVKIVRN
mmetsp:Transcript_4894/g.9832  ORF Transcript_4894/g.9832 Transcript_4894/m.9832 type:complete len:119 (+) Transcript_4894:86-442(+)